MARRGSGLSVGAWQGAGEGKRASAWAWEGHIWRGRREEDMGAGGVSGRAIEVVPGGQARAEGRDAAGENRTRAGRESAGLAGMAMAGWVSPRLPAAATRLLPSDAPNSGGVASSMDLRSPSSRSGSPASNRPLHEARPLPPATLQSPARVRLRLLSDNGSLRHCRQPPRRPFSSSRHHQASVSPEQFRGGALRQERARHQARQRCAAPIPFPYT